MWETKAKTAGAAHGRRVSRSGGGARAAVDAGSAERPMSSGRGQETTTTTTTTIMRRQLAARNGPKAAWESGVVLKAGHGSKGPPSPTEAFGASGGPHRGILQRKENKESRRREMQEAWERKRQASFDTSSVVSVDTSRSIDVSPGGRRSAAGVRPRSRGGVHHESPRRRPTSSHRVSVSPTASKSTAASSRAVDSRAEGAMNTSPSRCPNDDGAMMRFGRGCIVNRNFNIVA